MADDFISNQIAEYENNNKNAPASTPNIAWVGANNASYTEGNRLSDCILKYNSYYDVQSAEFYAVDQFTVSCKTCGKRIKASNRSASNLITHYKRKHGALYCVMEEQKDAKDKARTVKMYRAITGSSDVPSTDHLLSTAGAVRSPNLKREAAETVADILEGTEELEVDNDSSATIYESDDHQGEETSLPIPTPTTTNSISKSQPTKPGSGSPLNSKKRKAEDDAILKAVSSGRFHIRHADDDSDIFGKSVASRHRKLTPEQKIHAQKYICDILYEAELGLLSVPTGRGGSSRGVIPSD